MPLRLVDAWLPEDLIRPARRLAEEAGALSFTPIPYERGLVLCRIVVDQDGVESLLDGLEARFGDADGFRAMVFAVEASIPRPDEDEEQPEPNGQARSERKPVHGVSVQELYEDVAAGARIHTEYIAQVVISTVVAAIGVARDLPAVVIGAMVIAPLLGPHMALALATTLVDAKLARRAVAAAGVGMAAAFVVGVALGFIMPVDPASNEVASRTSLVLSDVVLALGSGTAGALAYRSGLMASIVGVMVAVALMPPAVVMCLMLAAERWRDAAGAGLLLATNIICVNLAAVITFAARGVHPRRWHEKAAAAKLRWVAIGVWLLMLGGVLGCLALMNAWTGAAPGGPP